MVPIPADGIHFGRGKTLPLVPFYWILFHGFLLGKGIFKKAVIGGINFGPLGKGEHLGLGGLNQGELFVLPKRVGGATNWGGAPWNFLRGWRPSHFGGTGKTTFLFPGI